MDVKGIGGLINGLSGKFVSSVTAVTCAVLFVFVERIAYSRPHAAYREIIAMLNPKFRRKSAEYLLYQIQRQIHAQTQNQLTAQTAMQTAQAALQEQLTRALAALERNRGA